MHPQRKLATLALSAALVLALSSCATGPAPTALSPAERLAGLRPVSSAMLEKPAPGDWLQWGRAYDGQNFSPLKHIDRANVKDLAPAWRAAGTRTQHAKPISSMTG